MNTSMVAAASLFAAGTAVTTAIGWQERLPSEPFGTVTPGTGQDDPAGKLLLATGVSAPWPMPVLALIAALAGRPDAAWPARTLTVLGVTLTIGVLIEPVSYGLRSRKPPVLATVPLNLATAAVLILAGRRNRRA